MGSATCGLMHSGSPTGRSASLPLPRITETPRSERWPRPCLVVSQRWDRGRRSQQHGRTEPRPSTTPSITSSPTAWRHPAR